MKLLFWLCASLIIFAYAGYPICMYFRARFWPRPVRRASIFPRVTIVLVVHNEEKNLPGKLVNLAALDYPADRLEMVVVSDGSTDETNKIVSAWQKSGRRAVILPEHRGKANGLNHGMAEAQGEIICFTDARQEIASDGLKNLVANFADPSVGCASGELILRGDCKGTLRRMAWACTGDWKKIFETGRGWPDRRLAQREHFMRSEKISSCPFPKERFSTTSTFRSKLRGKAVESFSIRELWLGMISRLALNRNFAGK